MAEIILTNILNKKISFDDLFEWLTADNPEEIILPDVVQNGSTRAEFVSYFLNYLREQCKSILPEAKEIQEKPAKKLMQSGPQQEAASMSRQSFPGANQGTPYHTNRSEPYRLNESPACYNNDYNPHYGGQPVLQNRIPSQGLAAVRSPPVPGQQGMPAGPRIGSPAHLRMPAANFPPLPYQLSGSSPVQITVPPHRMQPMMIPANFHPKKAPQFPPNQMPGNWNSGPVPNVPRAASPRQYLNNSGDGRIPIGSSSPYHSPNVNFGNSNPAIIEAQMPMANLNLSSQSGGNKHNFSNASAETNSPQRFHNSMMNGSSIANTSNAPFSPMSPLYANNISNICPRRNDKSQNETSINHDFSCGSANLSKASGCSTPKNASGQKSAKSGQNQSLCLGDFMKTESQGSKKSSKKQIRSQLWRKEHGGTSSPANEKKSQRRINPTRLDVSDDKESRGKEIFGVISRPTAANPKFVGAPSADKSEAKVSFEVERGLLKLERQRQPKTETTTEVTNPEQKLSNKSKSQSAIVPCLDLIENVETVNTLARLYSGILHENLMTNPMTELYFLVTLLTAQYKKVNDKESTPKKPNVNIDESSLSVQLLETLKDDLGCAELTDELSGEVDEREDKATEEDMKQSALVDISETRRKNDREVYLGTAHNCFYFATMVMLDQQFLLSTLDRATLKLLCENQQIAAFQPELLIYLSEIYSVKCLQTNRIKQSDSKNLQTNVCFQVDTDNRETFPSLVAFSLFRKQRDLFYDILKNWEDHHLAKGWVFQSALKHKINALLTTHTDPVNYCHFAKLFISQLLVSSLQNGQVEDPMDDDESLSFLKSLKHLNPEKLMQLKERLVTPLNSMGPVPEPVFPGVQEFYKEFILNASNWKFYVILEMSFIREIVELNEAHFTGSEIEGTGTTVDESTKLNFISCVSSLRLLAKFLSFTVSLPFRSASNSSEWFGLQIHLRSRIFPSLDLRGCLVNALTHKRLSVTVPWIVQYMAMLDELTLRLPYYANVGELLYCIYRGSNQCYSKDTDNSMSMQTAILMMFTVGWLFDLPNFPRDLHASWQINYDPKKLRMLGGTNGEPTETHELSAVDVESSKEFVKYKSNLDILDIIDDRALYECCPFLAEFKILLISGNAVLGNNNANRHITPVSSQLSQPTFGVKKKNLQMQLEEAFFHGQPSSIRKTVDFVAERVASSCVKYICNTIIPSAKERNMKAFIKSKNCKLDLTAKEDEEEEEKSPSSPEKSPTKMKVSQAKVLERQMQELASTIKTDVKYECREKLSAMRESRTTKSIESLLADDAFPCVKETCIAITNRIATERIDQWIDSHIVESLFLKNMTFELKKLLKDGDVDQPDKENRHNPDVPRPTEVIGMMRNSMWELLENRGRWSELSEDSVAKTLTCLQQTLSERADLIDHPQKNLYTMSVDFCLLLMTNRQDLYTAAIQQHFIDVWKMNNVRGREAEALFVRIISPRNIRLLTNKSQPSTLRLFGRLLKGLLKEDLLSIEALSEQCVALFRQEWPSSILKQLSQCLNEFVSDYKSSNAHAEGVKYLLGWIATTCDEMEICDYD